MQGLTRTQLEAVLDIGLIRSRALTTQNLSTTIALISKQRMADVLHVGADLMGASCFQPTLYERGIAIALQHLIVGDGRLADVATGRVNSHTLTVAHITTDITFYTPGILSEVAPHKCLIRAVGIVIEELGTQFSLGIGCLRHHQQTTGIFIDAMYESHTGIVGVVAGQVAQVPGNGIDQRTVEVTHARVYHQSGRFVDHHQLVVLVDHIQRNILRLYLRIVVRTVEHQRDDITRPNLVVALDGFAIDLNEPCIGGLLNTVARGVLHVFRHVFVNAYRLLTTIHLHAQMLIELAVLFAVCGHQFNVIQLVVYHISSYSSTGGAVTSSNSSMSVMGE